MSGYATHRDGRCTTCNEPCALDLDLRPDDTRNCACCRAFVAGIIARNKKKGRG